MNPVKLFSSRQGVLAVGGRRVDAVVEKIGTPLYLYDAGIIRKQYRKLKSSLPKGTYVHYSLKANPNKAVAGILQRLGAGAEVASGSELELALAAGFKPERIIFAGPGKSEEELALAVRKGIGSINVESVTELERVLELARRFNRSKIRPRISFRVNLDFSGGEGEVMIGGPRKFGVDDSAVKKLVSMAVEDQRVEFLGFHCFAGTQITNTSTLVSAYKSFAKWAKNFARKTGVRVKSLNFGGGLGIPFKEGEAELNTKTLGRSLTGIRENFDKEPLLKGARFILEPGRYLVGPAGIYISRVTDIKSSQGERYVITDGGIHHALIPIVLNKNYPSAILNKIGARRVAACVIAGPLCASSDQFSRRLKLPKPEVGDLVGIFNSGAYGYTAGMLFFLSHPTPAEAMIDGGKVYLIREPKKPEHGMKKRISI